MSGERNVLLLLENLLDFLIINILEAIVVPAEDAIDA